MTTYNPRKPFSFSMKPELLTVTVVLFILVIHNQSMFSRAAKLSEDSSTLVFFAIMAFGLTLSIVTLFSYFGSVWIHKTALIALLVLSSITAFFTDTLGVVFDDELVNNIVNSNSMESAALIDFRLIRYVIMTGVLPSIFVILCPVTRRGLIENSLIWTLTIGIGLCSFASAKALGYKNFVQISRGDMNSVTYALQPGAFLVASVNLLESHWKTWGVPFVKIGLDAHQGEKIGRAVKPVVVFLVLGETARAQSWEINGYERATNPLLSKVDIVNFGAATSCATSTIPSLRCMFSKFGRVDMSYVKFATHENLLDIAAHAKVDVEWYDNDWTATAGGVAERIKVNQLYQRHDLAACAAGECYDSVFFEIMDKVVKETTGNKIVVFHLVGSHFPYYRRYPKSFEEFQPACNSPVLSSCSQEEIVNSYDNSIRYTDFVLANIIDILEKQSRITPALLYTSDHGESLGEAGVFLHSAPFSIAPVEQTTVPLILWMSENYVKALNINVDCVKKKAAGPISHDNIFHTSLGLLDIETHERQPQLDLLAGCN